jgi:hypothetical protein
MFVLLHFCTSFPADAQVSDNLCYKLSNDLEVLEQDAQLGLQPSQGRGIMGFRN